MVRAAIAVFALVSLAPARPAKVAPAPSSEVGVLKLDDAKSIGPSRKQPGGGTLMPLQVSGGIDPGLEDWITCSFGGKCGGRSLVVPDRNARQEVVGTHEMSEAYIAEVRIGMLQPRGKNELTIDLKVEAEADALAKPQDGAAKIATSPSKDAAKQKKWLTSNFRFEIDGLPTDRVLKIEPLTWKRAEKNAPNGAKPKAKVSDLRVHLDKSALAAWQAAARDGETRSGQLVLGAGPRTCAIEIKELHIKVVVPPKKGTAFVATLGVEGLDLDCS